MKAEQDASQAALDAASNAEICFVDCLHTRCDMGETERNIALALDTFAEQAASDERAPCAVIAREFCRIDDSDILREGDARRIYEHILERGEVTR